MNRKEFNNTINSMVEIIRSGEVRGVCLAFCELELKHIITTLEENNMDYLFRELMHPKESEKKRRNYHSYWLEHKNTSPREDLERRLNSLLLFREVVLGSGELGLLNEDWYF